MPKFSVPNDTHGFLYTENWIIICGGLRFICLAKLNSKRRKWFMGAQTSIATSYQLAWNPGQNRAMHRCPFSTGLIEYQPHGESIWKHLAYFTIFHHMLPYCIDVPYWVKYRCSGQTYMLSPPITMCLPPSFTEFWNLTTTSFTWQGAEVLRMAGRRADVPTSGAGGATAGSRCHPPLPPGTDLAMDQNCGSVSSSK